PYVGFSGSIFTNDAVHLNHLGEILMVTPILGTSEHQIKFARYLGAVRRATDKLRKYYQVVEMSVKERKNHIRLFCELSPEPAFPWPTTYEASNTQVRFTYELQPYPDRLIFIGKLDNDDTVLIKFTKTYSLDAHRICAALGCAPQLLGYRKLGSIWYMVVMECLDPDVYKPYSSLTFRDPADNLLRLGSKVRKAIGALHSNNLVHGDIRDANILVNRNMDDFKIIDFDWAGEANIVCYPTRINHYGIVRPRDAQFGMPITKEHDKFMLNVLFPEREYFPSE
ncbi:1984_t:CDS:1, partial [Paraglomus brasilianum]